LGVTWGLRIGDSKQLSPMNEISRIISKIFYEMILFVSGVKVKTDLIQLNKHYELSKLTKNTRLRLISRLMFVPNLSRTIIS
jgi:hypothetical protein